MAVPLHMAVPSVMVSFLTSGTPMVTKSATSLVSGSMRIQRRSVTQLGLVAT